LFVFLDVVFIIVAVRHEKPGRALTPGFIH
jgi:hypothetical protein